MTATTEKGQGRPTNKAVASTGVLKRNAKTNDLFAFQTGLGYSGRLYGVKLDRDPLERRKLCPPELPEGCAEATRPEMPRKAWLQRSIHRKGYRKPGGRPLVISRGAGSFDDAKFPLEQLMMWAELWRNSAVAVVESHGLGLAVRKRQSEGFVVARGVLDGRLTWRETLLLLPAADGKAATLLGPASLVNCGCATCASGELNRVGDTYEVKLRRRVEAGEEILCCYTVEGGQMVCDVCQCPVE